MLKGRERASLASIVSLHFSRLLASRKKERMRAVSLLIILALIVLKVKVRVTSGRVQGPGQDHGLSSLSVFTVYRKVGE